MKNLSDKKGNSDTTKDDQDNHSTQLNPNNDTYWKDRGHDHRPDDWQDQDE